MMLQRPWGALHYLDEGSGPLVVLLHPLATSGGVWWQLIAELTAEFRVVAPDARGHGASTWNGVPFSVPDLAEDVAALVERLDAGPARVAALSMGGCTAIAMAIRHPGLVDSLVLADTTADYGPDKRAAWAERAEKAVSVPREKQLTFQRERWFSPGFLDQHPAEVERVSRIFTATDSRAHAAACHALGGYDDACPPPGDHRVDGGPRRGRRLRHPAEHGRSPAHRYRPLQPPCAARDPAPEPRGESPRPRAGPPPFRRDRKSSREDVTSP